MMLANVDVKTIMVDLSFMVPCIACHFRSSHKATSVVGNGS